MTESATDFMAQVSYPGVRIFYPMENPSDRQILAEHVLACSHLRRRIEVAIGAKRWVLDGNRDERSACPECGARMVESSLAPGGQSLVCVRCAIEASVAGLDVHPGQQRTT